MSKASITANYSFTLKHKKSVDIRFFAGQMFNRSSTGDYRFRMSGQTGYQDYLYDNIYFARTSVAPNIGFQQFTETDGAFKVYSPVGQSDNWIMSLNIKSPKLFKLPLLLYADAGTYSTNVINIGPTGVSKSISKPELLYSTGIGIPIIKNVFEFYIPILNSKNIQDAIDLSKLRFVDTIRFTLNLTLANPLSAIKNNLPL
jgi:hypothetical protein